MRSERTPRLTVVGAGPGNPEYITLAGIRALESADVVLYDALANSELLKYAENAELVFVGKRRGYKRFSQEKINELIVEKAGLHGHVVRLKGGDPFIFGRGSEELVYARSKGLMTAVVPGLSSALSVPAGLGIPVTHRGVATGFSVITATVEGDKLTRELDFAARSNITTVILMGMKKLPRIIDHYLSLGMSQLPVSVIQNGSLPNEKYVIGRVDNIVSLVKENNIENPAVIILGEVVKEAEGIGLMKSTTHKLYL